MKKIVEQILKSLKLIKNSNEINIWLVCLTIVFFVGILIAGWNPIMKSVWLLVGLIVLTIHVMIKVAAIIDDYIPKYSVGVVIFVCVVILCVKVSLFLGKVAL